MPNSTTFDTFILTQAAELRAKDRPPASLADWQARKKALRDAMFAAMGPTPEAACDLSPQLVSTLARKGYRIEKLLLQSRPDVWVTASAYVPEGVTGKVPAVLVVHGHWAWARRDPVVQARCLGLAKLGFFVLAVDAFSAGERHPTVGRGTYHGALLGSALWPAGHSLLGLQVYDNRRAVDYLLTRPEVDGKRLGVTGASGGGNQSMYAGALDERFAAVVPVCSVGTYQAYLRAACCVCEVLPGALRFTEEGDVLGLVAPRGLLVINATKDALQFSVGEAKKSVERARAIFKLHDVEHKVEHLPFESPHDYNQPMREAMYGFMTRWLKGEGKGLPIPEPAHEIEKVEDLACYPPGKRPASFVFAPDFAAKEARALLSWHDRATLDHVEAWEGHVETIRGRLDVALGPSPKEIRPDGKWGEADGETRPLTLTTEPGMEISVAVRAKAGMPKRPACVLLHLDGKEKALAHPLAAALLNKGWVVYAPDLRGTGAAAPKADAIAGAPDHNSCEHALWIGRPLLGQWVFDVRSLLEFMLAQDGLDSGKLTVVGLQQAGVVALVTAAIDAERPRAVVAVETPVSFVTQAAYPAGWRMGLLAPGVLRAGDVPQLAAMAGPRRLVVAGGVDSSGKSLDAKTLEKVFAFARNIYGLQKREKGLVVQAEVNAEKIVEQLA